MKFPLSLDLRSETLIADGNKPGIRVIDADGTHVLTIMPRQEQYGHADGIVETLNLVNALQQKKLAL